MDAPLPIVLAFVVLFGWPVSGIIARLWLLPHARPLPF
jgi:hypothetical protein